MNIRQLHLENYFLKILHIGVLIGIYVELGTMMQYYFMKEKAMLGYLSSFRDSVESLTISLVLYLLCAFAVHLDAAKRKESQ